MGAGLDYLAGEEVGVYYWEGVGWGGEEAGDGGFAGGEGAGEAYEYHFGGGGCGIGSDGASGLVEDQRMFRREIEDWASKDGYGVYFRQ